jgi:hypothetical protein
VAGTVEVLVTLRRSRQAKLYFFVLISRTINRLSMVYGRGAVYELPALGYYCKVLLKL